MSTKACLLCGNSGPFEQVFASGPYRLVRCPECRLVFQPDPPGPDGLAAAYYHDPAFTEMLFGPLREVTLARAREKLPLVEGVAGMGAGRRALDVGCSSGAWLEVAAGAGWLATGVELGAATAETAREHGLDVRTGTLSESFNDLSAESFDLITFWDVLEHLPDPVAELELAARLLTPGGVIAVTFPNVEGLYPRATHALIGGPLGIWEYPELPVHLYDFAPETATALMKKAGLEVVAQSTSNTPFEHYRTTTLAGRGTRARIARAIARLLRVVLYPLAALTDRGNTQFIAARSRMS
ncbi:MAG: hypothetical protein QOG62_2446 [Thermoleophilaceae bacterium]|nr:hypothetical protein [Thermoleophilaceae bacterium]